MSAPSDPATRAATHAEAQRDRILSAAQRCFVEHGFHAASMANIAESSGMSAGLIYRYFHSKQEIILAIIERQLDQRRADIARLSHSSDLVAGAVDLFVQWRDADQRAALFLEMTAEASRNPQIAEALRKADLVSRDDFRSWLTRSAEHGGLGLPNDLTEPRAIALQSLVEGLAIRAVREPDLDPETLRAALAQVIPQLLSH